MDDHKTVTAAVCRRKSDEDIRLPIELHPSQDMPETRQAIVNFIGRVWPWPIEHVVWGDDGETQVPEPTNPTDEQIKAAVETHAAMLLFEGVCPECLDNRGTITPEDPEQDRCEQTFECFYGHTFELYPTSGGDWAADGRADALLMSWHGEYLARWFEKQGRKVHRFELGGNTTPKDIDGQVTHRDFTKVDTF